MNAAAQPFVPAIYPQQVIAAVPQPGMGNCRTCSHPHQTGAKYCGNCGNVTGVYDVASAESEVPSRPAPHFAHVTQTEVPKELLQELGNLLLVLVRERIFLFFHCTLFLALTATGILTSARIYNTYVGDEVTRVIISLTPILFINIISLGLIAPITGTKRQIRTVKYRLLMVRHRIEYRALL